MSLLVLDQYVHLLGKLHLSGIKASSVAASSCYWDAVSGVDDSEIRSNINLLPDDLPLLPFLSTL